MPPPHLPESGKFSLSHFWTKLEVCVWLRWGYCEAVDQAGTVRGALVRVPRREADTQETESWGRDGH